MTSVDSVSKKKTGQRARRSRLATIDGPTGLMRPDNVNDVDYVRIDVRGDGCCLFYSVLLATTGLDMLPTLAGHDHRAQTTDKIADLVRAKVADNLGVTSTGLPDALEAYQWRERAAIARHWLGNPAKFQTALRGDVRSVITGFLQNLQLLAPIFADAAVGNPTANVAPRPKSEPEPVEESSSAASSDSGDDESVEQDDASDGERPVDEYDASGDEVLMDEDDAPDREESVEEDDPERALARARTLSRRNYLTAVRTEHRTDNVQHPAAPVANTPPIDEAALAGMGLVAKASGRGKGIEQFAVPAPAAAAGALAKQVATVGIGSNVPPNGQLAHDIRTLLLTKIKARYDTDADIRGKFTGAEFSDQEVDGLIRTYIAEFAGAKVYTGQAVLAALRELHDLEIETHTYHGAYQRIIGDDESDVVKVLETPGHFQALIGPFHRDHLMPPGLLEPPTRDVETPARDEVVTVSPKEPNLLGLTCLGVTMVEDKKKIAVIAHVGKRLLPAVGWLEDLIEDGHLLQDDLRAMQRLLHEVETTYQGGIPSDALLMLHKVSLLATRLEVSNRDFEFVVEVETGLTEAPCLRVQKGIIYTDDLVPLQSHLGRILAGPLATRRSYAGAGLVYNILQFVLKVQGNLGKIDRQQVPALLGNLGEQLHVLSERLAITALDEAKRQRPMKPMYLPFMVFWPTEGDLRKHGIKDVFSRDGFTAEVNRQARLQQLAINGMSLEQWMINRDTFNLKVTDRRERIIEHRSASYLGALADTMLVRNADLGDKRAFGGKRKRMADNNEQLSKLVPATDALDYLMKRTQKVHDTRTGGTRFDPSVIPDADEVTELLTGVLDAVADNGAMDEDGVPITSMQAKDLVGRSNSQTGWRRDQEGQLVHAAAELRDKWTGLIPPKLDSPLTGLAALHNPDQVAGGERDLPDAPEDLTHHIGPAVVNSALGATWGLPDSDYPQELPTAQYLEEDIRARYPEESWPLLLMNVVLLVEITEGTHVVPPAKRRKIDAT